MPIKPCVSGVPSCARPGRLPPRRTGLTAGCAAVINPVCRVCRRYCPCPALIQLVFVTNWPGSFGGGGDVYAGNGKRKRGPGRGRGKTVPVVPSAAPAAAKPVCSPAYSVVPAPCCPVPAPPFKGAGNWLAGNAIGRVVAKGSQALGWLGRGASPSILPASVVR